MCKYNLDFEKPSRIYFIGIGGISMSGLAKVLIDRGFDVSGSDINRTSITRELEDGGVRINYSQISENITEDIECIVYTAAVHMDNAEFKRAVELNIPMLSRAQLLGQIISGYDMSIAVSGTHGKTTTTSMLSHILIKAHKNPTISVGGILPIINGNILVGGKELFLTEACEYTNSFLSLEPDISLILNIEEDHLDFFKDIEDIRASFKKFISQTNKGIIINSSIADYRKLTQDIECDVLSFGFENADIMARNIIINNNTVSFELFIYGELKKNIELSVLGEHNILNALAAIATAYKLGIDIDSIDLSDFKGPERRFQKKGELAGNISIIDDYAHHPQEIEASLKTAKAFAKGRVWCVFQPHTYTRTKALLEEFAASLSLADEVVLAKIYPARETDTLGVSSEDIIKLLKKYGKEGKYFESFDEIENYLLENLQKGDMCITMGAGDIVKVGEMLLGE